MNYSRGAWSRDAVLDALEDGPLCESDIQKRAGVPNAWLANALVGLLHEGAVEYIGPRSGKGGKGRAFYWQKTLSVPPVRPREREVRDGDGRNDSE